RRHTRFSRDWSSDVCSSDLAGGGLVVADVGHVAVAELAAAAPTPAADRAVVEQRAGVAVAAVDLDRRAAELDHAKAGREVVEAEIGRASCRERAWVSVAGGR